MKLLWLAVAVVLLAGTARAQDQAEMRKSIVAVGSHTCDVAYFPPDAWLEERQGDTDVVFTIKADGTVADPSIHIPSGHDDLDRAALACVKHWTYRSTLPNPVDVRWRALVRWIVEPAGDDTFTTAMRNERAETWRCVRHSAAVKALPPDFDAVLQVHFTFADVTSPQVSIVQSSGNAALDRTVIDCAMQSPWLQTAFTISHGREGAEGHFAWYPGLAQ